MDEDNSESDNAMDSIFEGLSDDGENGGSRSQSQRRYKQQYRKAWEKQPDFRGWLTSIPGQPTRAYCRACKRDLHAHRLTLLKHTISVKHMKAAQQFYEQTYTETKPNPTFERIELEVDASLSEEEDRNGMGASERDTTPSNPNKEPLSETIILVNENELLSPSKETSAHAQAQASEPPPRSLVIARPDKPPISTHVLDTTRGLPVAGIQISLYQLVNGRWTHLNDSCTNPDGRCVNLIERESLRPGRYKMHFETHQYFELRGQDCLFPFVEVVFDVRSPAEHLHIPVLMTPYSYSVYRGS